MKRAMILILTLCLCISTTASAESLFDFLITPAPEVSDKAPSYGAMANVDASDIQDYGEKGQVVTYEGVDEDGYNGFIKYLAELGYEAVQSNVTDQSVEMIVNNGTFNIGLAYYAQEQKLMLVYDQGVAFEKRDVLKAYFPSATRIVLGQEIKNALGAFIFTDFVLGGTINISVSGKTLTSNTWLEFDFYNTTTDSLGFNKTGDLFSADLVYINEDNTYSYSVSKDDYYPYKYSSTSYEFFAMGECTGQDDGSARISNVSIPSLEGSHLAIAFNLPDGSLNSDDGYLALCITFNTEKQEKYILVLREDSKKVGEWR